MVRHSSVACSTMFSSVTTRSGITRMSRTSEASVCSVSASVRISRITSAERRQRLAHRGLAALDALGQLNFAFARQQRNGAHLAQVHAHRIVGLVAEILGELQVGELLAFFEFLVELDFGLFQNLDAGACRAR